MAKQSARSVGHFIDLARYVDVTQMVGELAAEISSVSITSIGLKRPSYNKFGIIG